MSELLLPFTEPHTWATLLLLLGLELILGVDNILVISILTSRLPEKDRSKARTIGLTLALVARLLMLLGVSWLIAMDDRLVIFSLSIKDLVLLVGGLFLIYKAVKEIHHVVEHPGEGEGGPKKVMSSFAAAISQIVMLDIVFSLDSVITAVGLTSHLIVIAVAVIVSFIAVLLYAGPVADFIIKRPALKILALALLVCIGTTLVVEGMNQHVPKAYIYLPMGFAIAVELLQMRHDHNRRKHPGAATPSDVA